jgi:hypothetical protein
MVVGNSIIEFLTHVYIKRGNKEVRVFSKGEKWFVEGVRNQINTPTGINHLMATIESIAVSENERTKAKKVSFPHFKDIKVEFLNDCIKRGHMKVLHEKAPHYRDDAEFYNKLMGIEVA